MNTLEYFVSKYKLDLNSQSPIEIRNVGRDSLPHIFKELGFKVGAEIGVERGRFTKQLLNPNPELKIFAIDPWITYKGYTSAWDDNIFEDFFLTTQERLKGYNVEYIRKFSMDALADIEDDSLDFVYIDGNHAKPFVDQDIAGWTPKVRVGGIVAGHDYIQARHNRTTKVEVKEAVHAYTELNNISPWFLLGTTGRVEGEVRDSSRTWFWVKS
jgi:hypothetical protein